MPKKPLSEQLRKLADELDAATGRPKPHPTPEAAIEAHIAEITRPGSFKERLFARRRAKARAAGGEQGDDGSPASPPAIPSTGKRKPPKPYSPTRSRKR